MTRGKLWIFLLGLLCGAAAALLLPPRLAPHLPSGLASWSGVTEGTVDAKRREGERLLLTLVTEEGVSLVSFTARAEEVDLLVRVGDRVTLTGSGYRPFLQEPKISRVRKPEIPERRRQRTAPESPADNAGRADRGGEMSDPPGPEPGAPEEPPEPDA